MNIYVPASPDTQIRDLVPDQALFFLDDRPALVEAISLEDDVYTIDVHSDPDQVIIKTKDPLAWFPRRRHQRSKSSSRFEGLHLGDVVTRGKGKLQWRVTGLSFLGLNPVVTLVSMPEDGSPQGFGAVGATIATLKRVEA